MLTHHFLLNIDWRFLDSEFAGEKIINYIWCVSIIAGTIILRKLFSNGLSRISSILASRLSQVKHEYRLGKMIRLPLERLMQTILYYIAINQLSSLLDKVTFHRPLGKRHAVIQLGDIVDHVFLFFFILYFTQVISRCIDYFYKVQLDKAKQEKNKDRIQLMPLIKDMGKLLLWTLSAFWVLGSVFHVNIPALITGLGIGGVAIALAGKTTVENLFAAFTILSDKPFQTGDTVRIGDMEGAVERVGFRSTRIRGGDGSAYIIPNQTLVVGNLINLSTREVRGMKLIVNIKYGVSHSNLEKIVEELKQMLKDMAVVRDPIHVLLDGFGNNTFQLSINYFLPYVLPEGSTVEKIKQEVNMHTYEILTRYGAAKNASVSNTDADAEEL